MEKLLGVDRAQVRRAMIQYNTSYWQLPTRGFSVTIYNSRGNQIDIAQIAIIKCWFLVRGENRSTRGKTSHSRVENQQTQSTFDAECGNQTQATLVEGKCSHHNANPATKTKTKTDMMLLVDANLTPPGVPQGSAGNTMLISLHNAMCKYQKQRTASSQTSCISKSYRSLQPLNWWVTMQTRGLFLESPETFRVDFRWHNSLCIFKTKVSRGTKLSSYFDFYSLYNIWKYQLHRKSESEFYEWLFGPEKPLGLSRNGPQFWQWVSVLWQTMKSKHGWLSGQGQFDLTCSQFVWTTKRRETNVSVQ